MGNEAEQAAFTGLRNACTAAPRAWKTTLWAPARAELKTRPWRL